MKAKRVHIPLVQLRHAERPEGPPLDGPPRLRRPRLLRRRKGQENSPNIVIFMNSSFTVISQDWRAHQHRRRGSPGLPEDREPLAGRRGALPLQGRLQGGADQKRQIQARPYR